jgi:DNA replication protein DnaC
MSDMYEREQFRREMARRAARRAGTEVAAGWSLKLETPAAQGFVDRHPELFKLGENDALQLRVTCRVCRINAWLELVGDAGLYPGMEAVRDRVSPIALWVAQRWCCEGCSAIELLHDERADTQKALNERVRQSGIERALAASTGWKGALEEGESPDETQKRIRAIDACRRWSEQQKPKHALLLWGPPGSGKTWLAATTAMARLSHSPMRWIQTRVLMAQLEAAFNDDARHEALKVLLGKGPIVLDDVDKLEGRHQGNLYAAIDSRDQAGQRAIIMTTNLKPAELEKKLGDVVMSRITGLCHSNAGIMHFPGPDRRLELGKNG